MLEASDHAVRRGARVLAELCGVGMTIDSGALDPGPRRAGGSHAAGARGRRPGASGDRLSQRPWHATKRDDHNETRAIKKAFGKHASHLAISSPKSMYGHPLGASAGIAAVACIKAMENGWVPPTIGLDEADPECDLDYVPNVGRTSNRLHDVQLIRVDRPQHGPHVRPAASVSPPLVSPPPGGGRTGTPRA